MNLFIQVGEVLVLIFIYVALMFSIESIVDTFHKRKSKEAK